MLNQRQRRWADVVQMLCGCVCWEVMFQCWANVYAAGPTVVQ